MCSVTDMGHPVMPPSLSPRRIKDAGHQAKGKGSTKEQQGLQAALQHVPQTQPSTMEAPGTSGKETLEGSLGGAKPQSPLRRKTSAHPQDHTVDSPHCMGWGTQDRVRRAWQLRQRKPRGTKRSPESPAMLWHYYPA